MQACRGEVVCRPVLPAVPSVMRPPSCSKPSAKASSMMCKATLSFTLPPGFRNSALAIICITKLAGRAGIEIAFKNERHPWALLVCTMLSNVQDDLIDEKIALPYRHDFALSMLHELLDFMQLPAWQYGFAHTGVHGRECIHLTTSSFRQTCYPDQGCIANQPS